MSILKIVGTETELRFDSGRNEYEEERSSLALVSKSLNFAGSTPAFNRDYLGLLNLDFVSFIRQLARNYRRTETIISEHRRYRESSLGYRSNQGDTEDVYQRFGFSGGFSLSGHRIYLDGSHPEVCTPECSNPMDVLVRERAGMIFFEKGRQLLESELGVKATLYKNNTTAGFKSSWGAHENYLVSEKLFEQLTFQEPRTINLNSHQAAWVTFLVSRYSYSGSGLVLSSQLGDKVDFCISQRSNFMQQLIGLDTTINRPLINTRDIPYVDKKFGRRLHVIVGDANMCELPVYLKIGMAMIVLMMLEDDYRLDSWPKVNDPISVLVINRDMDFHTRLMVERGGRATLWSVIDIQSCIVDMAHKWFENYACSHFDQKSISWIPDVLERVGRVLRLLCSDRNSLFGVLDWVTKLEFIERRLEKKGFQLSGSLTKEVLKDLIAVDLNYHRIDNSGLYRKLELAGRVYRLTKDEDIARATKEPPLDTRAYNRSQLIRAGNFNFVNWQYLLNSSEVQKVNLESPWRV